MALYNIITNEALSEIISKIKTALKGKVDAVSGKGLSTNDLTDSLKATYDAAVKDIETIKTEGGEPNTIETVKVNGTALTPDSSKAVNVTVPTDAQIKSEIEAYGYQTSDNVESAITAKGYQTATQVQTALSAYTKATDFTEVAASDIDTLWDTVTV